MRYLELDGQRLSRIGLGCWQFGEKGWGYGSEFGDPEAAAVMARALELGVTVFDTAEIYGRGASETLVGKALLGHQHEVFLATKFLPLLPLPHTMVAHLARSLDRLQVPLVDLYQIHFPNPAVPLRIQAQGLREVLAQGMTRQVGVSNFTLGQWKRIERELRSPVISNQVRYNLLQRKPERELLDFAADSDHIIFAYSPLAQGALSGRYRPGKVPSGLRRSNSLFTDRALAAAAPLVSLLEEMAQSRGATPSQIALAYVISHPRVIAIPGAKSVQQLESNCAAADIVLSDDELLALRRTADLIQYSKVSAYWEVARAETGRRLRRR